MNTLTQTASAGHWPAFKEITPKPVTTFAWSLPDVHATIFLPLNNSAAGSIVSFMPVAMDNEWMDDFEIFDELDAEIARMSPAEIDELILESAGIWADRDDLDELLDRSDRIDELYAHTSDHPHSPV